MVPWGPWVIIILFLLQHFVFASRRKMFQLQEHFGEVAETGLPDDARRILTCSFIFSFSLRWDGHKVRWHWLSDTYIDKWTERPNATLFNYCLARPSWFHAARNWFLYTFDALTPAASRKTGLILLIWCDSHRQVDPCQRCRPSLASPSQIMAQFKSHAVIGAAAWQPSLPQHPKHR